jgi:DNA polymerase elongation subunit (family B)
MIGWNFIGFDWKYIYNRCKKIGIDVSRCSPSKKIYGKDNIPESYDPKKDDIKLDDIVKPYVYQCRY